MRTSGFKPYKTNLNQLKANETLVDRRRRITDKDILPSGTVHRIKQDTTGVLVRHCAGLDVLGVFQPDVIDYTELHTDVVYIEIVRLTLALSV